MSQIPRYNSSSGSGNYSQTIQLQKLFKEQCKYCDNFSPSRTGDRFNKCRASDKYIDIELNYNTVKFKDGVCRSYIADSKNFITRKLKPWHMFPLGIIIGLVIIFFPGVK